MGLPGGFEKAPERFVRVPPPGVDTACREGAEEARPLDGVQPGARRGAAPQAGGAALRRYRRIAVGLAVSDALAVLTALMASYAVRYPGHLVSAREVIV